MILNDYVKCLTAGDADGVVALFTENCHFNDGGARTINVPDLVVDGKNSLLEALKRVFGQYKVKAEIIKINSNSMEYDVILGDITLPCIGCATLNDGKIDEYIVRPR